MWLALLVLFVVLSPGVLFTLPALGKKMGGKFVIALMHSLLFVVVVALLNVTEAFQVFQVQTPAKAKVATRFTPEQTLARAEAVLQENIESLAYAKEQVVKITRELESSNFQINELKQQLATVQAANLAAQNKVNERNQALSAAQKEVLDTTTRMNMITNKISSLTRGAPPVEIQKGNKVTLKVVVSPERQLTELNNEINSLNAEITRSQAAVTAAKLAVNASKNVQRVEQAPSSMDSGSKAQDIAQAIAVATTAQVDAEAAVRVAAPPKGRAS